MFEPTEEEKRKCMHGEESCEYGICSECSLYYDEESEEDKSEE